MGEKKNLSSRFNLKFGFWSQQPTSLTFFSIRISKLATVPSTITKWCVPQLQLCALCTKRCGHKKLNKIYENSFVKLYQSKRFVCKSPPRNFDRYQWFFSRDSKELFINWYCKITFEFKHSTAWDWKKAKWIYFVPFVTSKIGSVLLLLLGANTEIEKVGFGFQVKWLVVILLLMIRLCRCLFLVPEKFIAHDHFCCESMIELRFKSNRLATEWSTERENENWNDSSFCSRWNRICASSFQWS